MSVSNNIAVQLTERSKKRRRPITVNLELLPICNLNCKMCYIHTEFQEAYVDGLISKSHWLTLAEELLDAGVLFLLLTGGEVFLFPEFQSLYESLCSMGFMVTINTNATLITEETVNWLKKYPPKCISISLYGASDATYEQLCGKKGMFQKVDKAIHLLQESGITIECKTLFNPINIDDMEKCWEYCKKHNIFYEMTTYAFPPVRKRDKNNQVRFTYEDAFKYQLVCNELMYGKENHDLYISETYRKYMDSKGLPGQQQYGFNCSASNSSCWITWQGHMIPCAMMDQPYTLPFQTGFENAWEELKNKCDKIKLSAKCSYCEKRSVCSTCPASNYAESNCLDGHSSYHCRLTGAKLNYILNEIKNHPVI